MTRKFAIALLLVSVVAVLGATGGAQAVQCDDPPGTQGPTPTAGHVDQAVVPVLNSHIYTDTTPGDTSGYAGIHGGNGYLEAKGDATNQSGEIRGNAAANPGTVNGRIARDGSGVHVCALGTTIIP